MAGDDFEPLFELEALTEASYAATGGDPRWGAAQRKARAAAVHS